MPSRYSRTRSTDPGVERKASAGSSSSSTSIHADLHQGTPRGPKSPLKDPTDYGFSSMPTLPEIRPRRPTPETGCESSRAASSPTAPSSDILAIAPTHLGPAPPPAPTQRGPLSAAVQPYVIAPPIETPRVHPAQPSPATDTPTRNHTTSALERTHMVWMFIGDAPSITRTSPTPPPALHPPRRGIRFSSSLPHRHSPLGTPARQRTRGSRRLTDNDVESERGCGGHSDSEDDTNNDGWIPELTAGRSEISSSSDIANLTGPTVMAQESPQDDATLDLPVQGSRFEKEHAGPAGNLSPALITAPSTPVGNPSHRRTLEDYDQTNARIRALNASLLADTRVQWQPRSHPSLSQLRTSASRSHSDRGGGVRYLNVPGAATDALMATVRRRASRRRADASAAGTGIVDISDSESSQFESDEEDDEESESSSPLGTESEAFEVETQTVAEVRFDHDPPVFPCEPPEPAVSSTATALAELEDRVSVASPWRAVTASTPQVDDARVADRRRLQPAPLLPALPTADAPTATTHLWSPDSKGKKRARDPDVDGGLWLDSARVEGVGREGKRRKVIPGASMSVSPPPSDTACRKRFDSSTAHLRD